MKILIVKTSSLGDLVHTFPVVAYLKEKFPDAQIDWVVEKPSASMIEAHPDITRTLKINTKSWRFSFFSSIQEILHFLRHLRSVHYDVLFDLQGNTKSAFVTLAASAKVKVGFGLKTVYEKPNVLSTNCRYNPPPNRTIYEDYLFLPQSFFNDFKNPSKTTLELKKSSAITCKMPHPRVMVCPGSAWQNKQLKVESLKRFLTLLYHDLKCSYVFIWGNERDRLIAEELQAEFKENGEIVDRLSFGDLQDLMRQMDLVVAMDSMALHLAGSAGTSTFSAFGPSLGSKYKPCGEGHGFIQGSCPYGRTFTRRCPILRSCKTGACIHDLTGDDLYAAYKGGVGVKGLRD